MKIYIQAKPRAHEERIETIDAEHYRVAVTEPPINGRANAAIVRVLATHFRVAPSCVRIVSGHTSRQKIIEVTS